jgi:hypothetical protein
MGLCMFCSQDRDTINSICTALFTDISQLLGHQSCLDAMNGFAVKQAYIEINIGLFLAKKTLTRTIIDVVLVPKRHPVEPLISVVLVLFGHHSCQ